MEGNGPFLWLNEYGPPAGFRHVPPGGMCLSVFLFVQRGGRLLLGKYREHPSWEAMAGLDEQRLRKDADRWTIPARQLRLGEDPRDAARHIAEVILGIQGLEISEPRVEVDYWQLGEDAWGPPERKKMLHFDVWFMFDATVSPDLDVRPPPWFGELAWQYPADIAKEGWGRFHEDVFARWLHRPQPPEPGAPPRTRPGSP